MTATLDTDYTLSSTTITLAEGETAGTVTITVTDDAEDDDGETIVIDAESTSPALTADRRRPRLKGGWLQSAVIH